MNFENIIKKTSAIIAGLVVFFMSAGMYLSVKGFDMAPNGEIVLMSQANAATPKTIDIPKNYRMPEGKSMGKETAPVTLYEYSSFTCYHCSQFHLNSLPEIKKEFVNSGELRIVFVNLPIDKTSMTAAMLAECVPDDKYFEFINLLFKNQRDLSLTKNPEKLLFKFAGLNGVDAKKAKTCIEDDKTAGKILEIRQNAISQLGIKGTPSFIIQNGENLELLNAAPTVKSLKKLLK